MLTVIPAIDLRSGRCVRLRQGRADDEIVYSDDPVSMARRWAEEGGALLHVVDLDGAFAGHPVHADLIGRIAAAVDIPVEVGGGIRRDIDVEQALQLGVERVIIGTRAFEKPEELADLVQRFGRRIVVGIDARDGMLQVKGWVETTSMRAVDLACKADELGVQTIIYTDTATDGMLGGVNAAAMDEMCRSVNCSVIASGGVSSADDIVTLRDLGRQNLCGAIVGKALYDARVTLGELLAAAR